MFEHIVKVFEYVLYVLVVRFVVELFGLFLNKKDAHFTITPTHQIVSP